MKNLDLLLDHLRQVETQGGPAPDEYRRVLSLFDDIAAARRQNSADTSILSFRQESPSFSTTQTMHGFVCVRPHGYAGDFEIIDRIYQHHVSDDAAHAAWDHFFHAGDAALAVRARKTYCVELFNRLAARLGGEACILNVASGPCRDVLEFKSQGAPLTELVRVHCVDLDENALSYAAGLLEAYRNSVTFERRNVLRARFEARYDLVWSAGLFDYFDDRVFIAVLKRLYDAVRPGGELVVGNFSPRLTSRSYMEFGDWRLNYRDEALLRHLAEDAGMPAAMVDVDSETTGVNLFLKIGKPAEPSN